MNLLYLPIYLKIALPCSIPTVTLPHRGAWVLNGSAQCNQHFFFLAYPGQCYLLSRKSNVRIDFFEIVYTK